MKEEEEEEEEDDVERETGLKEAAVGRKAEWEEMKERVGSEEVSGDEG